MQGEFVYFKQRHLMNPQKRSGAKKLTPTAGFPSCNNSGRGKKLFTVPFFLCLRIYNFVIFLFFHCKNVIYFLGFRD